MTDRAPSPDFPESACAAAGVWDHLAEWWDDRIGDGNAFQDLLLEPVTERLLGLQPGEQVLDIACGAGRFARKMAASGAHAVAFDRSGRFIRRAQQRGIGLQERIEYRVLNASSTEDLLTLGECRYDAAVCTMALMDMASILPLVAMLPRLLKPGARFLFSITHPVFNSGDTRHVGEQFDDAGNVVTRFGILVTDYLTTRMHRGRGIPGQSEPQYYFHRPLGALFNTFFEHGFVLDRLEEPALPPGSESGSQNPLGWTRFHTIPPVLVARMRLLGAR